MNRGHWALLRWRLEEEEYQYSVWANTKKGNNLNRKQQFYNQLRKPRMEWRYKGKHCIGKFPGMCWLVGYEAPRNSLQTSVPVPTLASSLRLHYSRRCHLCPLDLQSSPTAAAVWAFVQYTSFEMVSFYHITVELSFSSLDSSSIKSLFKPHIWYEAFSLVGCDLHIFRCLATSLPLLFLEM